jgi:peroxiredoxin
MNDDHGQKWVADLPRGPFDLTMELARWRELRDVVMPAELVTRMHQATTELAASQIVSEVVPVGSRAPGFELPNAAGTKVSLDQLLARGPVVLSFYRGVWCPFCNLEQRALHDALPQISARGASLVAISGMTPDNSVSMVDRLGLSYEVLTDAGLRVARRYGLVFALPEYLIEAYARLGHPVPRFNGGTEHALPIPATFVVDTGGIIRFGYANADYTYRADPADVLAALAHLS